MAHLTQALSGRPMAGFDSGVADQRQGIARGAAIGIVIDRHIMAPPGTVGSASANNNRARPKATSAPKSCATMKAGASRGRMPEKVLVIERPIVIAGFANEVDAVNQ